MLIPVKRMEKFLARALTAAGLVLLGLTILASSFSHAQDDAEERLKRFLEETDLRCVGCRLSPQGRWPWQVFLAFGWTQPNGEVQTSVCGGSIIWPGWVLTAAHCVVDEETGILADRVIAVAGNVDRTKGERILVQRIFPHEQYDPKTARNDIAVLRLATNYGDGQWIPLADDEADAKLASPGQTATIAGWGALWDERLVYKDFLDFLSPKEQEQIFTPKILRDAEVGIVDRRTCQARYNRPGNIKEVTDDHICAGETGIGVCHGDSGGALMVKAPNRSGYIQIGIAAAVHICGDPVFPGIFTRVSRYKDWIAGKISGK